MGPALEILAQLNPASISFLPLQFPLKGTLGYNACVFLARAGAESEKSRPRAKSKSKANDPFAA